VSCIGRCKLPALFCIYGRNKYGDQTNHYIWLFKNQSDVMGKKTFPDEQEEMPASPQKPEIEKPTEPGKPDIPQEDPQREPAELPPSAPPLPVTPPPATPPSPQGVAAPAFVFGE
jgi:hypothetical protein